MVSNFSGSVAGLDVGADVTLHGLKIGEVTDVGLMFDPKLSRIVAPVHYRIEAERIAGASPPVKGIPPGMVAEEMVRRGFRAALQAPSLISPGRRSSPSSSCPTRRPPSCGRDGDVFIVPSSEGGGFDSIARSANELLSKINRIDFDAIGDSIAGIAKGLDGTVNGPELKLASLGRRRQDTMRKLDAGAGPALAKLPEIANQLQAALDQDQPPGGVDQRRLRRRIRASTATSRPLMPQLNDTARSVRALADLLTRNPEALIKGRGKD